MCAGANHQGVAANVPAHEYSTVDDILKIAEERGEPPFVIICDEIEDSHNLGAIIRTAEACGAQRQNYSENAEMSDLILSLQKPRAVRLNICRLRG